MAVAEMAATLQAGNPGDDGQQGVHLTWFEFALRPDLLEAHLAALGEGKSNKPSAVELVTAFLEQAMIGRLADQRKSPVLPST